MVVRDVDADAVLATRDAQETAIVQLVQQMRGRARRAAPVVGHRAVREVVVDLSRVDGTALPDEREERTRAFPARRRSGRAACARMHQRLHGSGQETVVDEHIFFDSKTRVATLEVPGPVVPRAVAQYQILARGRGHGSGRPGRSPA